MLKMRQNERVEDEMKIEEEKKIFLHYTIYESCVGTTTKYNSEILFISFFLCLLLHLFKIHFDVV